MASGKGRTTGKSAIQPTNDLGPIEQTKTHRRYSSVIEVRTFRSKNRTRERTSSKIDDKTITQRRVNQPPRSHGSEAVAELTPLAIKEKIKLSYADYINSKPWAILRKQVLERDNHRCRLCDSTDNLHVHHRRYPTAKNEWSEDCLDALTTLCQTCHSAFHERKKTEKNNLVSA